MPVKIPTKPKPKTVPITIAPKTYSFKVVIEPDDTGYFVYCPALHEKGAATWGKTPEEAYRYIQEVVQAVVESMIEDGEPIPERPSHDVKVFAEPQVVVSI